MLLDAWAKWDLLIQIEKTHFFALKSPWFQVKEDLIELVSAILYFFQQLWNFPLFWWKEILSESALQGKTGDRSWYLYLLKGSSLWDLLSDSQDNGTCFVFCTNTCIAETTSIKSRVQRWCVVIALCREVGRVASKFSGSQCQGKEQNLVSTSLLSFAWTSQCCVESSLKWDEIFLFWQVPGNVGFK